MPPATSKLFFKGDLEGEIEGDSKGDFRGDFKLDMVRSRSGLVQVWPWVNILPNAPGGGVVR